MYMAFFSSAITTLKTLVVAIGAGLGVWGVVNLLEGYGNDNPGAKGDGKLEEADTFGVIGATIADNFDVKMPEGTIGTSILGQFK